MSPEVPRIKIDDLREEYPGIFDTAKFVDVGIGWLPLVRDFVNEALPHDPTLSVHEIREKWGGMRISADTPVTATRLAKGKAEIKSTLACEVCGKPGFVRRPPPGRMAWWRSLCDEHASPEQREWPRRKYGALSGTMQFEGQWYEYDRDSEHMVPIETPERFR